MGRVLYSQFWGHSFKTTGWLQSWHILLSFQSQLNEYQDALGI